MINIMKLKKSAKENINLFVKGKKKDDKRTRAEFHSPVILLCVITEWCLFEWRNCMFL